MANKPSYIDTTLPNEQVVMDAQSFDNMLSAHGVRYAHWRAIRCPVGLDDPDDIRRAHDHHENCSNGYIYLEAGIIRGLQTGNSRDPRLIDVGLIDGSTIQVTFPRFYEESDKHFYASYADRFYAVAPGGDATDLLVPHWDTIAASATGRDRLQFPASRVEHVVDRDGRHYAANLWTVEAGRLVWTTQDRPRAGAVMTVWYLYQPYYYCSRVMHEIRLAQTVRPDGSPDVKRMPYAVLLTRENMFRDVANDPDSPDSPRKESPPQDGGFNSTQ